LKDLIASGLNHVTISKYYGFFIEGFL